ncbi:PLP-dependent transferase [Dichomitus squalens]|uniref:PLP-dependent transferase n=1 Tax=Dichomitus squalens TaxID=114155 RepID=A0A4Q9NMS5_9APHY|nr:PLP-dependent transferase [Dichomitus squalens]TBU62725.1 PLP-dependent transferase [Dichomitus squalens]
MADDFHAPNGLSQNEVQHPEQSPISSRVLPSSFYESFISDSSKRRIEDPIRVLLPLEDRPGVISLLAGKPNADTFPITSLQFTLRDPVTNDEVPVSLTEAELSRSLQYSGSKGIPGFLEWLIGLQEYSHGRKRGEGWDLAFGTGSSDLIYKAVNALVNPGDVVLIEAPVYAGVIPMFHSAGGEMMEVQTDQYGIDAQGLRETLDSWPRDKPKPKVLYTVPYGCNPTGVTSTVERRLEVLELARKHNFLILEDDPYYYLYFGSAPRPPSYFTLERDQPEVGRVVRFDSLSKVLSSGMRIGFISAPQPIIDAVVMHTMNSNLQPPSFTQVLSLRMLQVWGYEKLRAHVDRVAEFYRAKRDVFERQMRKHLDGLAEWNVPEAGMFFWFKLQLGKTGAASGLDEGDSEAVIRTKALENGVLALPGTVFLPSGRKTTYVRASFSLLPEDQVDEALRRLRETILKAREDVSV